MLRERLSLAINLLIAAAVAISWCAMAFRFTDSGRLSARGLRSMKYFTVLSNLLTGVAAAVCAVCLVRGQTPRWASLLKYAGAVSVGLTFLTVMLFLGPVFGFKGMFKGANLWFHLLVPLLAMLDFSLLDRQAALSLGDSLIAVVPMVLYGLGYMINLLVNGFGDPAHTNDWYHFAARGIPTGIAAFAGMILGTWLLALLLGLPHRL